MCTHITQLSGHISQRNHVAFSLERKYKCPHCSTFRVTGQSHVAKTLGKRGKREKQGKTVKTKGTTNWKKRRKKKRKKEKQEKSKKGDIFFEGRTKRKKREEKKGKRR